MEDLKELLDGFRDNHYEITWHNQNLDNVSIWNDLHEYDNLIQELNNYIDKKEGQPHE